MNFRTDIRKSKENANNQYSMLKSEYVETLNGILEILKTPAHNLDVQEITDGWYTIGHPDFDHMIQLEVVAQGANLDLILLSGGEEVNVYPLKGEVTSAKLTEGNEKFAAEKILAAFDLHSKIPEVDSDIDGYEVADHYIKINNMFHRDVMSELEFRKKYSFLS